MEALLIKNLSFSYNKENQVLKNINISIPYGKHVALLGHNGSGKSTLAKLLVGLLSFEEGTITISGKELNKDNLSDIRNKVSIVFQNPDNQFIGVTVEDDIAFSLENRNIPRDKMLGLVKEYASKVGMLEFLDKEPSRLSGGQKQRVAIADALVINPEILILDEATSMLDPKGKAEVLSLIQDMKKDNPKLTVISITHDVEEAYLCDEVFLLEKGEVVANNAPKKIFNDKKLIEQYKLNIPFEIELRNKLIEAGIKLKEDASIKEMEDALWQLK